jgi:signal transduction histidine kinase
VTILGQVKLLRQIAGEFSTYAVEPTVRLEFVPIPLLIDDVIGPYRAGLSRDQRVEVDVPRTLPPVWIDRTLVARALTNLVENALQAMPEGGTLRLGATPAPDHIVLTVSDTGVGMDAEQVRRAFEPYFSTKTGGSGLGVPNAKRNIERCGGTLTIASAPGRGTTMTVTLPVAPPPDPGAAASA